ncbi:hypothetical protein JTB14_023571 [Gonioctena quinquepunctata]|nr:hypothetical protein JTB14_023571 [Gonioctena quinquepunctata]
MAGPSRTVRFFDADFETTVQKWLDETDSDVYDIRKYEDELVSEHDSRSEQSADSDCNENPEDDVAELCDRDNDVAEDECAGNSVAETDSEQFGSRILDSQSKKLESCVGKIDILEGVTDDYHSRKIIVGLDELLDTTKVVEEVSISAPETISIMETARLGFPKKGRARPVKVKLPDTDSGQMIVGN